ncbi:hypothetical protein P692DRAFT_20829913 [Suillus brevipes Sb2]|nr:hypothetical protein P692DRAFT_20829913 [Suillus brevipes Sb2]
MGEVVSQCVMNMLIREDWATSRGISRLILIVASVLMFGLLPTCANWCRKRYPFECGGVTSGTSDFRGLEGTT